MTRQLESFLQGQGRCDKTADIKKIRVNTFRKGCDNNPVELAAIHAAVKEDTIKAIDTKSFDVSCKESSANPSVCNSFL